MARTSPRLAALIGLFVLAGAGTTTQGQSPRATGEAGRSLAELSIEDLLNVQVTSVSRKPQSLSETAAAIFVITQDDIRRSGATTLAEVLRLAPGLEVARISSDSWAITARGFNVRSANKLLVLIDGRNIYEPLFAGVLWDAQDVLLEDIDRIEVIRGPGASVWGANAVNGVINILTKNSAETRGALVSSVAGNEDRGILSLRYGAQSPSGPNWRVFARAFSRDAFLRPTGEEAADDWSAVRPGFRIDWSPTGRNGLTIQGDAYHGRNGQTAKLTTLSPPSSLLVDESTRIEGANVLARWTHSATPASQQTLQLYFDSYAREDDQIGERRQTIDLDFHHNLDLSERQSLVWGVGLRNSRDRLNNSFTLSFDPDHRDDYLASAFVEDLVRFAGGRAHLTFGSKFEHNDFTGFEFQPTARASWNVGKTSMAWAAVSRAVRTPSQVEKNIRYNAAAFPTGGGDVVVSLFGNPDQISEELMAYEIGLRSQRGERLSVDVAAFFNHYHHLTTTEAGALVPEGSHLVSQRFLDNKADAHSLGVEVAGAWQALARWRISGWYSFYKLDMQLFPSSTDTPSQEGNDPRHQFRLTSNLELPRNLSFDAVLHHVSALSYQDVPAYLRADVRLAWRPRPGLELAITGQNLFDRTHQEFGSVNDLALASLVERTYDARLVWRFPRSGPRP